MRLMSLIALFALALSACTTDRGELPPNVILIVADDLGYGDLGCYGHPTHKTPSIDALAASGKRFSRAYANSPVCSPSRAALLTGRYQQRSGLEKVLKASGPTSKLGIPDSETLLSEAFKKQGYSTGLIGKWHLGYRPEFHPLNHGFDEFHGFLSGNIDYHSHLNGLRQADWWNGNKQQEEDGYLTDLIGKHSIRFVEKHRKEAFFMLLAHQAPHFPLQGRQSGPLRGMAGDEESLENGSAELYREMVEVLDEQLGKLMDQLRKDGLDSHTIVAFVSDNGPVNGIGSSGEICGSKGDLFEGGIRVPLIINWPGTIEGGTIDEAVIGMDLYPTLLGLAGLPLPEGVETDGQDLSALLKDGTPPADRLLFFKRNDHRAVISQSLKAVKDKDGRQFLFRLDRDPSESRNRIDMKSGADFDRLMEEMRLWEESVYPGSN